MFFFLFRVEDELTLPSFYLTSRALSIQKERQQKRKEEHMRNEKREMRKSLTTMAKIYPKNEEPKWNWRSRRRDLELFSASVRRRVLMLRY